MDDRIETLASLLTAAGAAHHQAFIEVDGDDPEWPEWYAAHLHQDVARVTGRSMTRSELTYLLVLADRRHLAEAPGEPWAPFYARLLYESDV